MRYYIDTCIWLNLFKKEGDARKGVPYWKIADNLLIKIVAEGDVVVVSDAVLKELEYKLHYKISYFCNRCNFQIIKSKKQDYELARKIEKGCNYRLSFMDCIHIAISKRLDCVLVTRDAELLWEAKGYVSSAKPEDLLD